MAAHPELEVCERVNENACRYFFTTLLDEFGKLKSRNLSSFASFHYDLHVNESTAKNHIFALKHKTWKKCKVSEFIN